MDTKTISLASLLVLASLGNVYFVYQGTTYRASVAELDRSVVELTGAGKAAFVTRATEAGAGGWIECRRGSASNYPNAVYCHDSGTAGWLIGITLAANLLNEVKSKIPDITADEVRLLVGEGGKLWAARVD